MPAPATMADMAIKLRFIYSSMGVITDVLL
jgi:hypothetical protein